MAWYSHLVLEYPLLQLLYSRVFFLALSGDFVVFAVLVAHKLLKELMNDNKCISCHSHDTNCDINQSFSPYLLHIDMQCLVCHPLITNYWETTETKDVFITLKAYLNGTSWSSSICFSLHQLLLYLFKIAKIIWLLLLM